MLDKLIELISGVWDKIIPFTIIREYEKGAILRFGILHKIIDKGIHFKIPFFDEISTYHTLTTAMTLDPQSLTTLDNKEVVVKAVIKYKIADISMFFTHVFDPIDAISDVSMGIIKNIIAKKSWADCKEDTLDNEITKKVRVEGKKWGLEVEAVTLSDISLMRSIRLLNFYPKELK